VCGVGGGGFIAVLEGERGLGLLSSHHGCSCLTHIPWSTHTAELYEGPPPPLTTLALKHSSLPAPPPPPQEMRHPVSPRQVAILRQFGPFVPASMINVKSGGMTYRHTANLLQQALLQGHFSVGSNAAAAAGGGSSSGSSGRLAEGRAVGSDGVLEARRTLLREQEALFDAGLRAKYCWMVLREGQELLLDLMSGSYLWLSRVEGAAPQQQQGEEKGENEAGNDSSSSVPAASRPRKSSSRRQSSSSSRPQSLTLDPSATYTLSLELPDGTRHPVATAAAALQLIQDYEQQQQQQGDNEQAPQQNPPLPPLPPPAAAAAGSSSLKSSSKKGPLPLALPAALDRAERVAAGLSAQQAAFLSRGHWVRLSSMVGGWRVPLKSSEAHPCLPASE